jgi:hypothetical protein
MAGQGSALAMTSSLRAGRGACQSDWAARISVWQLRNALARLYQLETEGGRTFFHRLRAKDLLGAVSAQSSDKGLCYPGLARLTFGRDIVDTLQLPDYGWSATAT